MPGIFSREKVSKQLMILKQNNKNRIEDDLVRCDFIIREEVGVSCKLDESDEVRPTSHNVTEIEGNNSYRNC